MKKIFILNVLIFCTLTYFCENVQAQYFNKYYMWASEKHMDPGTNNGRLPFTYNQIKFTLAGNFYGAKTNNDIDIPGIAYIVKKVIESNTFFAIYTVESRGYRVLDPVNDYSSATFTNIQEGLSLDFNGNEINGIAASGDAYTEHPTVEQTA